MKSYTWRKLYCLVRLRHSREYYRPGVWLVIRGVSFGVRSSNRRDLNRRLFRSLFLLHNVCWFTQIETTHSSPNTINQIYLGIVRDYMSCCQHSCLYNSIHHVMGRGYYIVDAELLCHHHRLCCTLTNLARHPTLR